MAFESSDRPSIPHEFPIPRLFPLCGKEIYPAGGRCESRERLVQFLPSNSSFRIICSKHHHHNHNGKTFIAPYEFEPGGDLHDVDLPLELRPTESELASKRWKVSSLTKKHNARFRECANCSVREFNTFTNSDPRELWQWLEENEPALRDEVLVALREHPGIDLSDWYFHTPVSLRTRIFDRAALSILSDEHSVAKKLGNAVWSTLSRAARTLLQTALVFRFCRRCNLRKGAKRLEKERVVKMYVDYHYDGSIAFARADESRWRALQEILVAVYQQAAG